MRQLLVNTQINLQVLAGNSACNPPSVYDTFAILLKMKITLLPSVQERERDEAIKSTNCIQLIKSNDKQIFLV